MAAVPLALHPHLSDRPVALPATGGRYFGLAVVVLVHVALIAALLQYAPVRRSIARAAPIMVSVITPQAEVPPPPPKQALAPKPLRTSTPPPIERVPDPPPVVSESTAVSPITLPPPAPLPPEAPVVQVASAPEPPPIVPPRFNADYLQNPAPTYPALARRMHEQGRVLIRVLVSADGVPERIELKTSSGFPRLDNSALETIRSWKFVPARQGEQKIAAWVVVPITFTLDG
jgi:protein TonB